MLWRLGRGPFFFHGKTLDSDESLKLWSIAIPTGGAGIVVDHVHVATYYVFQPDAGNVTCTLPQDGWTQPKTFHNAGVHKVVFEGQQFPGPLTPYLTQCRFPIDGWELYPGETVTLLPVLDAALGYEFDLLWSNLHAVKSTTATTYTMKWWEQMLKADATGAGIAVTLPTVPITGNAWGWTYTVIKSDASGNNVTVGGVTLATQWASASFKWDGGAWRRVA